MANKPAACATQTGIKVLKRAVVNMNVPTATGIGRLQQKFPSSMCPYTKLRFRSGTPPVQQPWRLISNIISITQCLYRDNPASSNYIYPHFHPFTSSQISTAIILAMTDHTSQSKPKPKGEASQINCSIQSGFVIFDPRLPPSKGSLL